MNSLACSAPVGKLPKAGREDREGCLQGFVTLGSGPDGGGRAEPRRRAKYYTQTNGAESGDAIDAKKGTEPTETPPPAVTLTI